MTFILESIHAMEFPPHVLVYCLPQDKKRDIKMSNPLRGEVLRLYKNLLYLGRDYPKGTSYFRERLKTAFMKNKDITDPEKIKKLVDRGDLVIKELEALYFLRKYRAMKKRYCEPEH
ncbi:LYR motif-containing protein 5A-like isoform X1 [Carassius auratus]|uniref:LYR motif-containing protein 5A-like isoform X1 n=2 Tax=Carassius auratus TaxID=7957 RepID=A0A6P6LC52_CARAU|nr:LYR motif-containing protein 5A-like isoform X1 [Carassius auratus]XP_052410416.1 LYR motif-containing protein 5A isoform X1 [Carassius gibelio]